jgi:hypothetical protein
MANIVQLKRSSISGRIPDAANLSVGEPVINLADQIIFTKNGSGSVIVIGAGTTSNIAEGTNLYFTNARAVAAFTDGSGINIDSNGLISASISESYFQSIGGNIIPSVDSQYNLGSPSYRWKTLYLANNTIDLGGALIKSDGTGQIQISATGAILPSGSKLEVSNLQKEIATLSEAGTVQRLVPLHTQTSGLNTAANTFVFSANPDLYVFKAFTLTNGSPLTETSITLFTF